MPQIRSHSLSQVLVERHGVPREEVRWRIYCEVFPPWSRLWRNTRLYLGADPFDAEYRFVWQLAEARSTADIDGAMRGYDSDPDTQSWLARLVLRCRPDQQRVVEYFDRVMRHPKESSSVQIVEARGEARA